jgi:hypothetical protein
MSPIIPQRRKTPPSLNPAARGNGVQPLLSFDRVNALAVLAPGEMHLEPIFLPTAAQRGCKTGQRGVRTVWGDLSHVIFCLDTTQRRIDNGPVGLLVETKYLLP